MASSFPGAIDSFTTKVDGVDDVLAAHVNDLQDAVVAIQDFLLNGGVSIENAYPVGSIFMSIDPTNPATIFGFGTWVAWGAGRVPVGVDIGQTEFDTVEETGGAKTHQLSVSEMPSHNHFANNTTRGLTTSSGTYSFSEGGFSIRAYNNAGGDQPHNNLQPYITCYMWKRTA